MSEKTNLSVGILAGNRSSGINQAKAKAGNRYVVRKLAEELSSIGEVMISASAKMIMKIWQKEFSGLFSP